MTYILLLVAFWLGFSLCMFLYEVGFLLPLSRDDHRRSNEED